MSSGAGAAAVTNAEKHGSLVGDGEDDELFLSPLTSQAVNYLDVKLHRIEGLPAEWYEGENDSPAYNQHPFRYEVSLTLPPPADDAQGADSQQGNEEGASAEKQPRLSQGTVVTFAHGRLLAPLSQYDQYVVAATPPSLADMDDISPLQDVPEALEPPASLSATVTGGESLPAATEAAAADGAGHSIAAPPVILWVATEKTDAASLSATAASALAGTAAGGGTGGGSAAADKKARKKAAAAVGAGTSTITSVSLTAGVNGETAPLPLPDKSEPAPCVLRLPLDTAQQTHLETLLSTQQPLTLVFRRVLRPGVPADWEDFNAGYYQASIPVSLDPFAEPGSLRFDAAVPLRPARPDELQAEGTLVGTANSAAPGGVDHERAKKKQAARRNKTGIPAQLYEDPDTTATHPFLAAQTTAVVSLSLQRTLTRLAIDRVRPAVTPQQLIPARTAVHAQGTPAAATPIATVSASEQVSATLEGIARKILRDFKESKKSQLSASSGLPTAAATQAEKEAWRTQFLELFQSSGQLAAYKAQLTPLVVRLVQERFGESGSATREQVSSMSNELYVYLLESMHATLRRLASEEFSPSSGHGGGGDSRRPATAPGTEGESSQSDVWWRRAVEAEAVGDFPLAATYHQARINCACDDWGARAREAPLPSSSSPLPTVWTEAANFYVRVNDSVKAEQCYREAIACDAAHLPALLGYGMLLMSYGRLGEAAVFLHGAVDVVPQHALVWGCIALLDDLYMLDLKEGSPLFAPEKAKWEREHRYAVQQATKAIADAATVTVTAGDGKDEGAEEIEKEEEESATAAEGSAVASGSASSATGAAAGAAPEVASAERVEDEDEAVYLLCARYATQLHHHDLANVSLARCQAGSVAVESLYARIFTQGGQYRDAINTLDDMQAMLEHSDDKQQPSPLLLDSLVVLRATCEEALEHTEQAVSCYKRALCKPTGPNGSAEVAPYLLSQAHDVAAADFSFDPGVSPDGLSVTTTDTAAQTRLFFARAFLRLSNLLLTDAKYKDALGVTSLGLMVWPGCSTLWLGAGVAYHRMGNAVAAEECLNESNCVNPLNPRTWAYLTLQAAQAGGATAPAELEQCLQQTMLHGLADAALWAELGRELLLSAGQPSLSEVCLRRALDTTKDSQLASTSAYHLAHALAHLDRWEESRKMLEQVVHTSRNEVLKAKAEEELHELVNAI